MPDGLERFRACFDVSRETLKRLEQYEALIRKWSRSINLVSKPTLQEVWDRHFMDSAQVFMHVGSENVIADLGSGGGFPGVVLAIMAKDSRPEIRIVLVESDARKSAFLLTAVRELGLNVEVRTDRIEMTPALQADLITARALASLDQLCGFAHHHLNESGRALFLKGARYQQEVDLAQAKWDFDLTIHPSITNSDAALLELQNLRPKS
ncbi:16S rRNA m(7)G-527 methyltransferase [Litoreibacter ponti]|uniref:Ribosomal RNA small subunit methyltransferase G n=1 Tax=Litoreibacter ponti TaxID=1510457 RepID=A0A2T6BPA8_9RHOB|nr:16S rRNA (guanine(527)-N(7))-methyltransferase RsmG [Litoreibacter ponti]PTX57886.1 16S rRNA m(7)G-527 methyltransferase [Litoreibacter ponti]